MCVLFVYVCAKKQKIKFVMCVSAWGRGVIQSLRHHVACFLHISTFKSAPAATSVGAVTRMDRIATGGCRGRGALFTEKTINRADTSWSAVAETNCFFKILRPQGAKFWKISPNFTIWNFLDSLSFVFENWEICMKVVLLRFEHSDERILELHDLKRNFRVKKNWNLDEILMKI